MRYAGQLLDPTGLYYLRARQYDVGTGRLLTPDPQPPEPTAPLSALYVYGDDRPTARIDPSGLHTVIDDESGSIPPGPAISSSPAPLVPAIPAPVPDNSASQPTKEFDDAGDARDTEVMCPSCGERLGENPGRASIADRARLGATLEGRAQLYFEDTWWEIEELEGNSAVQTLRTLRRTAKLQTRWVEKGTDRGFRFEDTKSKAQLRYSTKHDPKIFLYAERRFYGRGTFSGLHGQARLVK